MNVKQRIAIEKKIAERVVTDYLFKGYALSVFDGEETVLSNCKGRKTVLKKMFLTDEDNLYVYENDKHIGTVNLVYGNDGFDVIADYALPATGPAHDIMEKISAWIEDGCK